MLICQVVKNIFSSRSLKKLLLLIFMLSLRTSVTYSFSGSDSVLTIAISDFRNNTEIYSLDFLEKTIPEMLKTELSGIPGLTMLERSKIDAILDEQALKQSGIIDEERAQNVGKMLGAQFILTGELSLIGDRLRIDTHLIQTETGKVYGEKVSGPDVDHVEKMVKILAQNIAFNLTGNGNRINETSVNNYYAPWVIASSVALGIAASILHISYKDNYAKYNDAELLSDFDTYYNKANRAFKTRNILAGASILTAAAGFALFLQSRSDDNKILAFRHQPKPSFLAICPYIDFSIGQYGFHLRFGL